MNYENARKLVLGIIFFSFITMTALYFITGVEITIEYFFIHVIICLAGLRWLKIKRTLSL